MAGATTGTLWILLNYEGLLFTASPRQTPFLSMIGGLTGGEMVDNFEFPTAALYSLPAASQPSITEDAEASALTPTDVVTTQAKNVCQTHAEAIRVSYSAQAASGRRSGISNTKKPITIITKTDQQIAFKLQKVARDVEFSFLQGTYAISTDSDVSNATRGLIECASDSSNTVAAGGAALTEDHIKEVMRTMYGNGAVFDTPVFIVNAYQKQKLSEIYAYAPTDRNIGGVNIQQIETDFGLCGVVLDPHQPAATLTIAEVSVCVPVFNPVPGKGGLFVEETAKTAPSSGAQLYGKIGLDHGPTWMHGTITGLAS